jgi:hypothetical protein
MSQAVLTGTKTIVIRSWKSCALWFVLTALPAVLVVVNKPELPEEIRILFELFAAFGAQAFISELLGMSFHADGVSFPRRPFPLFPFTLGRRSIRLKHISRIDSIDNCAVRFYLTSTERVDFVVPDGKSKWCVLRYLGKAKAARQPIHKHH